MQTTIQIKHREGHLEAVLAVCFDMVIDGVTFQLAVHRSTSGDDWTVTHVASGARAVAFADDQMAAQIAVWGPEHGPAAAGMAAVTAVVQRLGASRVRSVMAGAERFARTGRNCP